MTVAVTRFGWNNDASCPEVDVEMPPTDDPFEELDLRLGALGTEHDDADVLFAIYNGDEMVYHKRHLCGAVLLIDGVINQRQLAVNVRHGPTSRTAGVIEYNLDEAVRLAHLRETLAESVHR